MTTNSLISTTKQGTVMGTQLDLFGFAEITKSVKKVANFILSPEDADWGDIYDEYIDFNVCSQTW